MKILGICLILLVTFNSNKLLAQPSIVQSQTARQIVGQMQTHLTCPWNNETVDTFKTGNPDDAVTGIAVCMFADMETTPESSSQKLQLDYRSRAHILQSFG